MARVLLPLAWADSSLTSYGNVPYAATSTPLAWVSSSFPSYGCTYYGASMIAFGLGQFHASLLSYSCALYGASIIAGVLGYLIFAVVWLHVVWSEYTAFWLG